eukprot:GGOE01012544.1.p2 GENE.GGOE01012544.1~~GGOE01012544.1.p2  ORF type:complete len:239 (-),score=85.86 GGOE01012544.1:644-1303(-)
MAPMTSAPQAVPKRGRKAKADAGLSICLDYLKGKCTREQCRFVHPDLTAYQQLSEAVEAQAGREMCEVWAMTGQCKFGSKCNKLHPVMVSRPTGPTITIPTPTTPCADVPNKELPTEEPEVPHANAPLPSCPTPADRVTAAADLTAEFENFAECMRKTLEEEEEEEDCWQPSGKELAWKEGEEEKAAPPDSAARRFLRSVLGLDSVLIDIFRDLNIVSC